MQKLQMTFGVRLVLAAMLMVLLPACEMYDRTKYKPPPTYSVHIEDDGIYRFKGLMLTEDELKAQLNQLGQVKRNSVTDTSRTRIRIISPRGSADREARRVSQMCAAAGLPNVYFEAR